MKGPDPSQLYGLPPIPLKPAQCGLIPVEKSKNLARCKVHHMALDIIEMSLVLKRIITV